MKKNIVILVFLCASAFSAFGQNELFDDDETNEIIDNLLGEKELTSSLIGEKIKYQFLYFSTEYHNKTYFLGRDVGVEQFNASPQLLYMHSNGMFAGLSSVYYSEFVPNWDYISATLGYGKFFGKENKYRWSVSYARYFFNSEVNNPYKNVLSGGIGLTNAKKVLGTGLSASYLFGEENSFQITSESFMLITLQKGKNYSFKLRPEFSVIAGEQTYELERAIEFSRSREIVYDQKNEFNFLNAQLSIPVQFNYNNFDAELGYNINYPFKIGNEENLKITHYFSFSVGYLFDF